MNDNKNGRKKTDRKKEILEAASKAFIEKGYKGTTTAEIAQKANISEVTLFRYFPSKRELYMQSIEPVLAGTLKQAIEDSSKLSPKERLKYILSERVSFILENRDLIKLILMEDQLQNDLPSIDLLDKIRSIMRDILGEMELDDSKKKFMLRAFMGTMLSFLFLSETDEEEINTFINWIVESDLPK